MLVASEAAALGRYTQHVVHLDDENLAVARSDRYETTALEGGPEARKIACIDRPPPAQGAAERSHSWVPGVATGQGSRGSAREGFVVREAPRAEGEGLGRLSTAASAFFCSGVRIPA